MADDIKPLGDDPGTPLILKAEAAANALSKAVSFGQLTWITPTDPATDSVLDALGPGTLAAAKIRALQQGRFAPTTEHKQLGAAVALLDKQIEVLGGVRDKDDGGFHLSNPQNVVAVGAAIRDKLGELDNTIAATSSWIPDALRFGQTANRKFAAESDREQVAAADVELQHFIHEEGEKARTAKASGFMRRATQPLIVAAVHDPGIVMGIVPLSVKDGVQSPVGSQSSAGNVELGHLKPAAVPTEVPRSNNPKAR